MLPSLVKIIDGEFHEGELKLTLTVSFLEGQPKVGHGVFSPEGRLGFYFYVIEEITDAAVVNQYKLVLDYHEPSWVWETRWKNEIDDGRDIALCGLTTHDYQSLPTRQKFQYIYLVAEWIGIGRVPDFLKAHMEPAVRLALKDSDSVKGLTKFGGLPLARKDFSFPKDENGRSALFLGQIYIAEWKWLETMKQFKGNGVLYFFATITTEGEHHNFKDIIIRYLEPTDDLKEIDLPFDIQEYGIFDLKDVIVSEEINIPPDETPLWTGKKMTDEEDESYFEIINLLEFYNSNYQVTLLRPSSQLDNDVFFTTYLNKSNLTYKDWLYPDGTSNKTKWEAINKNANAEAVNWRHLFDFEPNKKYFQQLSNFNGKINLYQNRCILMIEQDDLNIMNFADTITIYSGS